MTENERNGGTKKKFETARKVRRIYIGNCEMCVCVCVCLKIRLFHLRSLTTLHVDMRILDGVFVYIPIVELFNMCGCTPYRVHTTLYIRILATSNRCQHEQTATNLRLLLKWTTFNYHNTLRVSSAGFSMLINQSQNVKYYWTDEWLIHSLSYQWNIIIEKFTLMWSRINVKASIILS